MKLRTAIKICRQEFESWQPEKPINFKRTRYNYAQARNAKKICKRKEIKDKRIPYIPTIDEEKERFEIMGCILIDVFCDDPDDADRHKEELLKVSGENGAWED